MRSQSPDMTSPRDVGMDKSRHANVEAKYGGPEGVIIDVSETGWVGTSEEGLGTDWTA